MNNIVKIKLIFWTHFMVALASHIFIILIVGGVFKLLSATSLLGFWEKGLILGVTFYTAMYATNHITNSNGFCVLTDLENYYRKQERLPTVKEFTPRFYSQCRIIYKGILNALRFKRGR